MSCPPLALYDTVATALVAVAPSFRGKKYLAQQDAPRRYVWVFTGEDSAAAGRVGGNARSLHDDLWQVEVHCWGQDFEEAYRLRQALITALRTHVRGSNYRLGRTVILSDEEHTALGDVFVVGLTLVTPLAEGKPPELADNVRPTASAKAVDLERVHVRPLETSPRTVTASGGLRAEREVFVVIDATGPVGVATFRYSLDAGCTWEAVRVPAASSSPLVGLGVFLHFAPATYQSGDAYVIETMPTFVAKET